MNHQKINKKLGSRPVIFLSLLGTDYTDFTVEILKNRVIRVIRAQIINH